jgi:hypothetical protein
MTAFKAFLRTPLQELCHHVLFGALTPPDTFHTAGAFSRESAPCAPLMDTDAL